MSTFFELGHKTKLVKADYTDYAGLSESFKCTEGLETFNDYVCMLILSNVQTGFWKLDYCLPVNEYYKYLVFSWASTDERWKRYLELMEQSNEE